MKYALVTGGSRGIGKAVCLKLGAMSFHVIVNYLSNEKAAEETLRQIKQSGGVGELLKFDVSDKEQVESALGKWKEALKDETIAVLVNNAGIKKDNLMLWMKDEEWQSVIDTNLNSFFYVTKFVLKDMLLKRYGRIINMVSLSGVKGTPGQINYAAAKAGVIGATKSLAQEVGKRNITVNAVAPGFITTDMTADIDEKAFKAMIPAQRFGTPEEVAELVGFLASEKSSYITGEVININGGLYT